MKPFAWTPADGKPTTTSPASIVEPSSGSRVDDADARAGEVELAVAVDAGSSAVSPPMSATPAARQTSAAPSTSSATSVEVDLGGGDVVEKDERLGAAT